MARSWTPCAREAMSRMISALSSAETWQPRWQQGYVTSIASFASIAMWPPGTCFSQECRRPWRVRPADTC
jgi:hypothetical protein